MVYPCYKWTGPCGATINLSQHANSMHLWTQMVGCGGVAMPIRSSKHRQKVLGSTCISASLGKGGLWIPVLFAYFSGPDKTIGFMFSWICKSMLPWLFDYSYPSLIARHATLHNYESPFKPVGSWNSSPAQIQNCRMILWRLMIWIFYRI